MTTNDNNGNDSKQITDVLPQNELDDIFTTLTKEQKDKKRMTFYLYWLFGYPIKSCAELSGQADQKRSESIRECCRFRW